MSRIFLACIFYIFSIYFFYTHIFIERKLKMRNWREVATRWEKFKKTPVGKAFLIYQAAFQNAIIADTELSFKGTDAHTNQTKEFHRISEKALETFVKEVEILIDS
jgi:hypothetical protein